MKLIEETFSRIAKVAAILRNLTCLFFGLGSAGNAIAQSLHRTGLGTSYIFDKDIVAPHNLCRTDFIIQDIGKTKVDVTARKILAINPEAKVHTYCNDILEMLPTNLIDLIEKADLVVSSLDQPKASFIINGYSYPRTPAVYSSVYPGGYGGDIIFTNPRITPCYECVSGFKPYHEISYETNRLNSRTALASDVQHIVSCATSICIDLLLRGPQLERLHLDPMKNCLFVGNSKEFIFEYPFDTKWAQTQKRINCTICGMGEL